jgi:hypothetical protein
VPVLTGSRSYNEELGKMGKGLDKKKETKKAPKLTTKEKKARKEEKKSNKA